jgi:hypothetical protein
MDILPVHPPGFGVSRQQVVQAGLLLGRGGPVDQVPDQVEEFVLRIVSV